MEKVSKAILAKQQTVQDIKDLIQGSKSTVIVKFSRLTVAQDTDIRNEFRKNNVKYKVLKNTLIKRALNDLGYTEFDSLLNGTTSVAFAQDEIAGAKIVADMSKKYGDKISAKAALVDNSFVDASGVAALAAIPSREVLIAKIVGCLASTICKFVYTVEAIRKSKEV